MASDEQGMLNVSTLEGWLWDAACVVRGPLDAPKFKDYILPLIFLKRLSDVFEDEVSGVVEGIEVLQRRFEDLMKKGREEYLPLSRGKNDDKAAEAVIDHFRDEEEREDFYRYFRELEELYEILSPSPFLRPHLDEYGHLTEIYQILRTAYEPHVSTDKSFLRKTAQLVQENTTTPVIRPPQSEYELTPEALKALAGQDKPDTVKVFNLLIAIRKLVEEKGEDMPYLLSIGERAESLAEAFEQRLITAQEALSEWNKVIENLDRIEERRKETDLSRESFSALVFLETRGVRDAEDIARSTSGAFEDHPHWRESAEQEREVRLALYKFLKGSETKRMVGLVNDLLALLKRASS